MTTTQAHAAAVKRIVRNCAAIRKTPRIPARGPTPLGDTVGMSIAVDMLQNSLLATSRIPGEEHMQFESVRCLRATFTKAWISSPQGIAEGAAFSSGYVKSTLTSCPTEQEWFSRFLRGCKIRMGYATKANCSLTTKAVIRLLELVKQEATAEEALKVAREYWKVGAAMATGGLRIPPRTGYFETRFGRFARTHRKRERRITPWQAPQDWSQPVKCPTHCGRTNWELQG